MKENIVCAITIINECSHIANLLDTLEQEDPATLDELLIFQLLNLRISNLSAAVNELSIYDSALLYRSITNVKTLLPDLIRIFSANDLLSGFKDIPGFEQGFSALFDLKNCLNRTFIDPFALIRTDELQLVSLRGLFKKEGILKTEFINALTTYLDNKANELGVDQNEIDRLIAS